MDRASSTRHQAQASNFPLTARSCAQNLFLPETICENINRALPARKVHLNLGVAHHKGMVDLHHQPL